MTSKEREKLINELLTMTTYTRAFFDNKSDHELYGIHTEIQAKINRYIREIMAYESSNNIIPAYTLEELSDLTYNDLILIRQEYGLSKRKHKNTKTKQSPQTQESSFKNIQFQFDHDLQIITIEEARMMYGIEADLMTEDQFQKCGFQLESSSYSKRYSEEEVALRREIVFIIMSNGVRDENDEPYQEYYLELRPMEELRSLYEEARRNIPRAQPFEVFVETLKKKIGS